MLLHTISPSPKNWRAQMRFEAVLCNDPTTVRQEARLEKRRLATSASTNALPKGR